MVIFGLRLGILSLPKTSLFIQIRSSQLCTILSECLTDLVDVEFLFKFFVKIRNKRDIQKIINCTDLKKKNPNLVFVCDPVMGDTGPGWYVPQTLLPIYRDEILPLADVCVPNQVCIV